MHCFKGVRFVAFILLLMEILFTNIVDPDQMPHYVASDLGLHCLYMTLLQVSGAPVAQWVKRWPTDLADRVRSSLEVKSSQP